MPPAGLLRAHNLFPSCLTFASATRNTPCSQACMCADRWVAPVDLEQGAGKGGKELAQLHVHRPADLAWIDLACQVLPAGNHA